MVIFNETLVFATVLGPIILALVELTKRTINYPKNYIPLVAVIIGVLVGATTGRFTELDIVLRIWAGIIGGLSATGLFELIKPNYGNTKGRN